MKGKKVLLIDERKQIGGAWGTITHSNLPEVEIGCHIWDVEENAYAFLKSFYALNLIEISPPPRILKYSFRFPYDWKMNILTIKKILARSLKFQFFKLKKELKNPAYRFSLFPKKYLYPQNGAKDIKNALLTIVKKYKLNIASGHSIKSVHFNESILLELSNGVSITTDELVITSLSNLPSLYFKNQKTTLATRRIDYITMHLLIKDEHMRSFSYDRIIGDYLIHRISDMTSQVADEIKKDYHLIAVGIFDTAYYENEKNDLESIIVNKLQELKYLSLNTKCKESAINIYTSYYNDYQQLKECAKKSKGKLRIMRSTNFMHGFSNQIKRWECLLNKDSK